MFPDVNKLTQSVEANTAVQKQLHQQMLQMNQHLVEICKLLDLTRHQTDIRLGAPL